jgi:hypothetical protein
MSIIQTQTTSFKKELYQGVHDLSTDTIKIALYTANVSLNADTTVYSATNEVAATGTYVAGGAQLTPITVSSSGYTAYVGFPNISWNGAITARCALIYNATQGNKSVCVLDFGSDKISTTTFTITMPANTATAALIRSSN